MCYPESVVIMAIPVRHRLQKTLVKSTWLWSNLVECLFHCGAADTSRPRVNVSYPNMGASVSSDQVPLRTNPIGPSTHEVEEALPVTSKWVQPLIPKNFQWLLQYCPVFPICGSNVRVITDPSDFYRELVFKASTASRQISISSLYLGTGKLEEDLVTAMSNRAAVCKDLCVRWLLDFTRGSRGQHNSRKMLMPLISQYPGTCAVSLYHTPELRGILKHIIPQRWNETIGLQHMKLYVFDDSLVISGANLSNDYFTNRQDRYIVFDDCPELANFCHTIIDTVSKFSLQLQVDDSTTMLPETQVHPFLGDYKAYCTAVGSAVQKLWQHECSKTSSRLRRMVTDNINQVGTATSSGSSTTPDVGSSLDTIVFPTLQMGSFNVTHDSVVTNKFLTTAETRSSIQLASGYFNLTEEYMRCILHTSQADYNILMAHPKANGFLGAKGFAGAIPAAYTQLAKLFFKRLQNVGLGNRISLFEYQKPSWTFHAKGLWYYQPQQSLPLLTMIGSPNFGWRSVSRDLESQVIVMTKNAKLQSALHQEQERLYNRASQVTSQTFEEPERIVPFWVRCVMPIIKVFF